MEMVVEMTGPSESNAMTGLDTLAFRSKVCGEVTVSQVDQGESQPIEPSVPMKLLMSPPFKILGPSAGWPSWGFTNIGDPQ